MEQIVDYEGLYEIHLNAVDGQPGVWSCKNKRFLTPQLKKVGNYQRYQLGLYKNGKRKTVRLHRLVAQHFIKNPENKPEVDHIDGDPSNNKLQNLRWVTRQENNHNMTKAKGYYEMPNGKFRAQIEINGKTISGGTFDTSEQARKRYLEMKKIHHPTAPEYDDDDDDDDDEKLNSEWIKI